MNHQSSVKKRMVGFPNLGNTCYISAVMQACIGLPNLRKQSNLLHNQLYKQEPKPYIRVASPFLEAVRASEMCSPLLASRSVYFVKQDLNFHGNKMQDASEFLSKLLEGIDVNFEEFRNRHTNPDLFPSSTNLIKENFLSERVEILQCANCQNFDTKMTFDLQYFCSLPTTSEVESPVPLEKLIQSIFETDELLERRCDKCGHGEALKSNRLVKMPRALVITVKMYDHDEQATKVVRPVNLQEKIDLSKYVSGHEEMSNSQAPRLCPQTIEEEDKQVKAALRLSLIPDCTNSTTIYKLSSVVRHYGATTESGHYIADVLREGGRWFRCDDIHVSEVNKSEVLSGHSPYNPYIVMYVQENDMDCGPYPDGEVSPYGSKSQCTSSELDNPAKRVKLNLFKNTQADISREDFTAVQPIKPNAEIVLFKESKPDCSPEYPILLNLTSIETFKSEVGEYLFIDPLTIDVIGICLKNGQSFVVNDINEIDIKSAFVCVKVRLQKKYLVLKEK